ncbi:UDP-N-acetylglucosamine (GlcNAc):hydroxyproline polypeptide GlcNAc-transferase [Tepidimonas ignava]|uniref:Glycosyltransferase (GlcNAc) n=1 Tax=Tepidimonas ignava TaxID=114249 RepID=A0A4R3LE18_9BURK|nr:GlcNAc-transferase family protein [Tepidimonas ignava]TCS98263.1 UDP-N-acetylglucosamine (GlcNAc):hydroxyproline polypeptide GlcNAc-transferase [Tepidimonas ignava]TSE21772.1 Glycosyltransferase (GlcNAc) [Tepidimonas ignava]
MAKTGARIFISVANYRDTETAPTIRDALAQAAQPQRVVFGVLSQVVPAVDDDCLAPEGPAVRQLCVHAASSLGACWARHRILTELRGDEPFVLQIDSHTRFAPGWDERFLRMWAELGNPRAVLSCHPMPYTPPRQLADPAIPVTRPKAFNEQGILVLHSHAIPYAQRPPAPVWQAFVGAGCIFAPAAAFDEVPYDPHLYFHGEESTLSARLYTHGWDVFAPNDVLLYHDYTHDRGRPKHWQDNRDWTRLNALSFARVRHLLAGEAPTDPTALTQIDRYGLGTARPLADFEVLAGVDFKSRTMRPRPCAA